MDYKTFTRTAAQRAGMGEDTMERVERATPPDPCRADQRW